VGKRQTYRYTRSIYRCSIVSLFLTLVTQATRSIAVIVALLTFKGTLWRTTPPTTFSLCLSTTHTHTSRGKVSSEQSAAVKYHKFSYTNCILHKLLIFGEKIFKSFLFRIQNIISCVSVISSSSSSALQPWVGPVFFFLGFVTTYFTGLGC